MRIISDLLFTALALLLSSNFVFGALDYSIHLRKETIKVISVDSGYISHVEYIGRTKEKGGKAYVHFNLLERVDDLEVGYFKKNGSVKKIRRLYKEDLSVSTGFYSDSRIYRFNLPEDKHFIYDYNKRCDELFYLSSLRFGIYNADTQIFVVQVPHSLNMCYEVMDTATLLFFDSKVSKFDNYTEYVFKGVCDTIEQPKRKKKRFIHVKYDPYPSVRLVVTPINFIDKEAEYFNSWMVDLVKSSEQMNPSTIAIIEESVGDMTNKDSITELLFDLVKSKIRYVDIEIGIGGFKPHDVNYILERKQGDCKDMANLLCQSLRHYGIDASLALSSSIRHRYNMDFPSLFSANHKICVVEKGDGSFLFLDATETEGYYLNPSRHIQGTSVFVIGEGNGFFLDVPIVNADENELVIKLDLELSGKKLIGNYTLEFNSINALKIKAWYNQKSSDKFNAQIKSYLSELSPRINYLNFDVTNKKNQIIITGEVEVPKSGFTKVGENNYLLLSFLPTPHVFFNDLEKDTRYIIYSSINTKVDLVFHSSSLITEAGDLDIDIVDDPLKFALNTSVQDSALYIDYRYLYDNVIIEKEDSDKFVSMDKKIKSKFSKAAVFK